MDYGTYEEITARPSGKNGTGNGARSRQLRQLHRVGARLRLRRHARSNSARRPSFTRPDTPNATSRYGFRTGTLFLWRSLFAAADRYDRLDARLLQPLDHRGGRLIVGNDLIDGAHVADLAEPATAELRRIGQHDHLLHRGDHLLVAGSPRCGWSSSRRNPGRRRRRP